jgi:uncharacterized SAM-binding protein YcdF (DUF218 family)
MVRRGVPRAAILVETDGRTSSESVSSAARLLREGTRDGTREGTSDHPRVLLVSDPFHMLRLDLLARLHGLSPRVSPTRTSPISANPLVALEYVLRESVAVPAEVINWVLGR